MASRTRAEINETCRLRRQKTLDYLNQHGPCKFRHLAEATGIDQYALSMDLNTMKRRGEVEPHNPQSRHAEWHALVQTTFNLNAPPAVAEEADERNEEWESDEDKMKKTPGLRIIRLLKKRNTSRGGQCANTTYTSIQCGLQERSLMI